MSLSLFFFSRYLAWSAPSSRLVSSVNWRVSQTSSFAPWICWRCECSWFRTALAVSSAWYCVATVSWSVDVCSSARVLPEYDCWYEVNRLVMLLLPGVDMVNVMCIVYSRCLRLLCFNKLFCYSERCPMICCCRSFSFWCVYLWSFFEQLLLYKAIFNLPGWYLPSCVIGKNGKRSVVVFVSFNFLILRWKEHRNFECAGLCSRVLSVHRFFNAFLVGRFSKNCRLARMRGNVPRGI